MDLATKDLGFDELDGIKISDFSRSSQELVEVIGLRAVIKLVEHFGGIMNIYIPASLKEGSIWIDLLGESATLRLIEWRGGEYIDICRELNVLSIIKERKITALKQKGVRIPDIARKFNMTERGVYVALRRCRERNR